MTGPQNWFLTRMWGFHRLFVDDLDWEGLRAFISTFPYPYYFEYFRAQLRDKIPLGGAIVLVFNSSSNPEPSSATLTYLLTHPHLLLIQDDECMVELSSPTRSCMLSYCDLRVTCFTHCHASSCRSHLCQMVPVPLDNGKPPLSKIRTTSSRVAPVHGAQGSDTTIKQPCQP